MADIARAPLTTAFDLPGFMAGANPRTTGVGEIGGNEYAMYLGELPQTPGPSPYKNLMFPTYDLPEAYKGKNEYMEDIVKGLVITERNDWIMSMFPVMETDQQHFKFTSYTLHRKLLGRVPNEGISRLLVSSKHQTFAHTVRRGIAMTLEGDFARTPEGQREYTNKMIGMAGCVVDTFKTESMFALMRAGANMRAQQAMYGNDNLPIEKILQREVDRFGILNCDTSGFAMVVEDELASFQAEGKDPDTLVVPPGTVLFMKIMPQGYVLEKVLPMQQQVLGPQGIMFTRNGADPRHTFSNGISMVEAPPVLKEPGNAVRTQAFYTTPVTSEHYPMVWRPFSSDRFYNGVTKTDGRRYESKFRDMYIFDAADDMHRKVTFRDALVNSHAFEDDALRRSLAEHEHDEVAFTGDDPALAAGRRPNATSSQRNVSRSLKNGRKVPLLLYWNEKRRGGRGGARARYFGQMDQSVAPTTITRQIADTLLAGCAGLSPQSLVHWEKGLALIRDLENATATEAYLKDLSETNRHRSVRQSDLDTFVGETTSEGDAQLTDRDAWGHSDEREWKPNVRGSMDLPQWRAGFGDGLPAGFASYTGIRELIAAYKARDWPNPKQIVTALTRFMEVFDMLYDRVKRALPSCEAVDPLNRMPWWHLREGKITFFEFVVHRPSEPLFLAFNKSVYAKPKGSATGQFQQEGTMQAVFNPTGQTLSVPNATPYGISPFALASDSIQTTLEDGATARGDDPAFGLPSDDDIVDIAEHIATYIGKVQDNALDINQVIASYPPETTVPGVLRPYEDRIGARVPFLGCGLELIGTPFVSSKLLPDAFTRACSRLGRTTLPMYLRLVNTMRVLHRYWLGMRIDEEAGAFYHIIELLESVVANNTNQNIPRARAIVRVLHELSLPLLSNPMPLNTGSAQFDGLLHALERFRHSKSKITKELRTALDEAIKLSEVDYSDKFDPSGYIPQADTDGQIPDEAVAEFLDEQDQYGPRRTTGVHGDRRVREDKVRELGPLVHRVCSSAANLFDSAVTLLDGVSLRLFDFAVPIDVQSMRKVVNIDGHAEQRFVPSKFFYLFPSMEKDPPPVPSFLSGTSGSSSSSSSSSSGPTAAADKKGKGKASDTQTASLAEKLDDHSNLRAFAEKLVLWSATPPNKATIDANKALRGAVDDITAAFNLLVKAEDDFTNAVTDNRLTIEMPNGGGGGGGSGGQQPNAFIEYRRAPLVMTSGLFNQFKSGELGRWWLARPGNPRQFYSQPWQGPAVAYPRARGTGYIGARIGADAMDEEGGGGPTEDVPSNVLSPEGALPKPGTLSPFSVLHDPYLNRPDADGEEDAMDVAAPDARQRPSTSLFGGGAAQRGGGGAVGMDAMVRQMMSPGGGVSSAAKVGAGIGTWGGYTAGYKGSRPFARADRPRRAPGRGRKVLLPEDESKTDAMTVGNFTYNVEQMTGASDNPLATVMALCYLMTRCDQLSEWLKMVEADVLVPCNIIVWRLMLEFLMANFILLIKGIRTGVNIIGNVNMIVGRDVMTKMIFANLTLWMANVIANEENIRQIPNTYYVGLVGGHRMRWFEHPTELELPGDSRPDLLATMTPITEDDYAGMMHISGTIKFNDIRSGLPIATNLYSSCRYYEYVWGFMSRVNANFNNMWERESDGPTMGAASFLGLSILYNPEARKFNNLQRSKCHRKDVGSWPGAAEILKGAKKTFNPAGDPSTLELY